MTPEAQTLREHTDRMRESANLMHGESRTLVMTVADHFQKGADAIDEVQQLRANLKQVMEDNLRQFTRLTECIEAGLTFDQATTTFVLDGQHYDTVTDALKVFQQREPVQEGRHDG